MENRTLKQIFETIMELQNEIIDNCKEISNCYETIERLKSENENLSCAVDHWINQYNEKYAEEKEQ